MVFLRVVSSPCRYYRRSANTILRSRRSTASQQQQTIPMRMQMIQNTSLTKQPWSPISTVSPLLPSLFSTPSRHHLPKCKDATISSNIESAGTFTMKEKNLNNTPRMISVLRYFSSSSINYPSEEELEISNENKTATILPIKKSYKNQTADRASDDVRIATKNTQAMQPRREIGANGFPSPSKTSIQKNKLETRAKVKLNLLSNAKNKANLAKIAHQDSTFNKQEQDLLLEDWIQAEQQLSQSYSQAIKYVARCNTTGGSGADNGAASQAERLMNDWIKRIGIILDNNASKRNQNEKMSRKRQDYLIIEMLDNQKLDCGTNIVKSSILDLLLNNSDDIDSSTTKDNGKILQEIIPQRRDFNNILHSWASSKARKKGLHGEALLVRMLELSSFTDEDGKRLFDTIPDSKAFALVAKCFANSTFNQAIPKIANLHTIHNAYADRNLSGIHRNDPFLLMHSLKALKNYHKPDEAQLAEDWMGKLHAFVIDSENNWYVRNTGSSVKWPFAETISFSVNDNADEHDDQPQHDDASSSDHGDNIVKINLAGTYTSIIREYARLRATKGAALNARKVLDMMHEVIEKSSSANIATMDIKANAYNLVLGSYRDSGQEKYARDALELLERMLHSARVKKDSVGVNDDTTTTVAPIPTEQSFEFCIQALANLRDSKNAFQEARRLVDEFESLCMDAAAATFDDQQNDDNNPFKRPSPSVHNALIELCNKSTADRALLLDMTLNIVKKIEKFAEKFPTAKSNVETWTQVLKACSYSRGDEGVEERALTTANDVFAKLEKSEQEELDEKRLEMTDKCYFYMIKCVANLTPDEDERHNRILKLFSDACEKGLVSANVLRAFKLNVSGEEFTQVAGEGRLADKWIANVTSGKALYTDGTMGGAGKHAFRKGKSTSGWAKKQRRRTEEIMQRKEAKARRKMQRKMKRW